MWTNKSEILSPLPCDNIVVVASMMPETAALHMATTCPWLGDTLVIFWSALRPLLTCDPAVHGKYKTDYASDGPAPRYIYERRHDQMHPLGSTSWCTRYGSACKRTYSIQPIFLFLEQNGRRFD
jgi:hypothetical protein